MEKYRQFTFQLRKKAIPNMRTRNTTPTTPCGLNFSLCCMSRSPFNKILTSEWQAIARNAMGQSAPGFYLPSNDFPDCFTPCPSPASRRCARFAFVVRFEAEDAAMRFERPCCPTIGTLYQASATFLKSLEVDGDHCAKRTLGCFGRSRAVFCRGVRFRGVRRAA